MDRAVPRRSEMTRLWEAKMPEKYGQSRSKIASGSHDGSAGDSNRDRLVLLERNGFLIVHAAVAPVVQSVDVVADEPDTPISNGKVNATGVVGTKLIPIVGTVALPRAPGTGHCTECQPEVVVTVAAGHLAEGEGIARSSTGRRRSRATFANCSSEFPHRRRHPDSWSDRCCNP